MSGYRRRVLGHMARFARRYRGTLEPLQLYAALLNGILISTEFFASSPGRMQRGRLSSAPLTTDIDGRFRAFDGWSVKVLHNFRCF